VQEDKDLGAVLLPNILLFKQALRLFRSHQLALTKGMDSEYMLVGAYETKRMATS
jgi:hypothetical protein